MALNTAPMKVRLSRMIQQRPYWLSLFAGAATPAALAPLYWWWIAIPSFALLYNLLQTSQQAPRPFRHRFTILWWFAFGQFLVGVSWVYVSMTTYGGTPIWMATPMVLVFVGFLALIPSLTVAIWLALTTISPIALATGWFISEWLRSWIFTGFPWLFIGDAHLDTPLTGWAPIIGSYGIGLLVIGFSAQLVHTLYQPSRRQIFSLITLLIIVLVGQPLREIDWTESRGEISVAALQGNIDQNKKWLPESTLPTIDWYHSQTETLLGLDLILWPETAVTMLEYDYRRFRVDLEGLAKDSHTTIITGIPYQHGPGSPLFGQYHNSITAFGAGNGLYHKQRLVPFGEYVPLAELIRGWIPFFDIPVHGFISGDVIQSPLAARLNTDVSTEPLLIQIQPFICYEIAYPDLVSRRAIAADLLITVSNDAWFGESLGPKQHLGLAQMRALETQRWVLRSTNTGITALIDHQGSIQQQLPTNIAGQLVSEAELRHGTTPYMQWRHYPLIVVALLFLLVSLIQRGVSQRRIAQQHKESSDG